MKLRKAAPAEFEAVRNFYWDTIDLMTDPAVGWKKGIYPDDEFILGSLEKGELYVFDGADGGYAASVIVNSATNEGYAGVKWQIECDAREVLIPHALAVYPPLHGKGIGGKVVDGIIEMARLGGKKAVRLDVLTGNEAAERLYGSRGFRYVDTRDLYYEDTGLVAFRLFELVL